MLQTYKNINMLIAVLYFLLFLLIHYQVHLLKGL